MATFLMKNDIDWLISESDVFIHLASETGTGQSMYNIVNYTNTNITGTSLILERLLNKNLVIKLTILYCLLRDLFMERVHIYPQTINPYQKI